MTPFNFQTDTESSHTISYKGYQAQEETILFLQKVFKLKNKSATHRVALAFTEALFTAIIHDPILNESYRRVTQKSVLPVPELVLPKPKK